MNMLRKRTLPLLIALGAVSAGVTACGDDGTTGPVFTNPATVTIQNELPGPVLFVYARACGTTDWGEDLLPPGPVEGTIQPGASKDITLEAGCYDLRADALPGTEPSPNLVMHEALNSQLTTAQPLIWILRSEPEDPA